MPWRSGMLEKRSVPATVFVKHQLITPRNVDLMYPLDDRLDVKIGFASENVRMATSVVSAR